MASDISDNGKNERVVDLRNLKDDVLGSDLENVEIERKNKEVKNNELFEDYLKDYDDADPADKLFEENPAGIDKPAANPNNAGDMTPLTTFASVAWSAPDRHHELISHAWRKTVIVLLVGMAFLALFWQNSLLTAVTFFGLAFVTSMHFWREARHERHEICLLYTSPSPRD